MKDFRGKLAVITGGGTGMGRALALKLAAEGCHVAVCDILPLPQGVDLQRSVLCFPLTQEPSLWEGERPREPRYGSDPRLAGRLALPKDLQRPNRRLIENPFRGAMLPPLRSGGGLGWGPRRNRGFIASLHQPHLAPV
jgi:hypothetical protein